MYRTLLASTLLLAAASACDKAPRSPADSLDAAAQDYLRLQLAIGEKEDGYIDAYYGPEALKAEGKAMGASSNLEVLQKRAEDLRARVDKLGSGASADDARRARFLSAQLTAAVTRLRMLRGEKLSFDEEAKGLFGLTPQRQPLSSLDPVLASIDKLLPGPGALADRVDAFQNRFVVPTDKLQAVFDEAIAGCKARTVQHIKLPPGEHFTLAFVTGKSWGGYNYYQGKYNSRIEINTDLPARISRAVDLGCHEGYPGHHVLNSLLEERLTRGRGWIEFSVYPLYSPQSVIAEGSANYGIHLAFPGKEKAQFEASRLYPLAGLNPGDAERYDALLNAMDRLGSARVTIEADFLDGKITEEQAIALERKYMLLSEERAKKALSFAKQYRSYILNYGLGQDMVRADVEKQATPAARWKRFEQIISEPTLPSDLKG